MYQELIDSTALAATEVVNTNATGVGAVPLGASQGFEDSIVPILLILFMLSLITEKVTNLIKLHVGFFNRKIEPSEDPALQASIKKDEKRREKWIIALAIIVGVVVAGLTNADFFALLQDKRLEPWTIYGSGENAPDFTYLTVLGIIITGVFLSQGSKFFHDLLDMVLYFKNARRSLYEGQMITNQQLKQELDGGGDLAGIVFPEDREDEEDTHL